MEATSQKGLLKDFKRDCLATLFEFIGATLFMLLGFGGIHASVISSQQMLRSQNVSNSVASVEQLLYISASMSLALLTTAWIFFRISGSVFNPNVALALFLVGALKPVRFVMYVAAQLIASIVASAILDAILPGNFNVATGLGVGTTALQGVFIEAFLTCALCLTVLFVAVEKHRTTPFAPIAIGLVLFAGHLFGVLFTGASLNTARSFGAAVICGFDKNHWVYWVGPSIGAGASALIHISLKRLGYHNFNPGQDVDYVEENSEQVGEKLYTP